MLAVTVMNKCRSVQRCACVCVGKVPEDDDVKVMGGFLGWFRREAVQGDARCLCMREAAAAARERTNQQSRASSLTGLR